MHPEDYCRQFRTFAGMLPLSDTEREIRTTAALDWIRRSIAATGGRGSAHSYHLLLGWRKAYPETTGYLIPTLLDLAERRQDPSLSQLAFSCADWLCTVQLDNGAFPGGTTGQTRPSVFNTAQILSGLTRAGYREPALRARQWLLDVLEPDGSWRQAAYIPGFTPAYYTRAVWPVLQSLEQWPDAGATDAMRKALAHYAGRFLPDGTVRDWSFHPGQPAFTHTIAYTLEGFLESAILLGEQEILGKTRYSAAALQAVRQRTGKWAGRYGPGWQGDYSFLCLCGQVQLALLYARLGYTEVSRELLASVLPFQPLSGRDGIRGGLPGSAPVWGAYMRFSYPNWGVKFLLDILATP
jgi:hypothetical protein